LKALVNRCMKQRTKPTARRQRQPRTEPKRDGPSANHPTNQAAVRKRFRLDQKGVYKIEYTEQGEKPSWICAPLEVLAHTRSAENEDWGKLLKFSDPDGHSHEFVLPMSMLAKDWASVLGKLLSLGLRINGTRNALNDLREYIQRTEPSASVRTVTRIGWYLAGGAFAFVLPDETIGTTNNEAIRMQAAHEQSHLFQTAGSLGNWRKDVAYYCQENSLLAFAVSCAFAAPLLPFSGQQGGGFHLVSTSTTGKTTLLRVAGSVWGGGSQLGFCETWNSTMNGLENTAEWHNHCLLLLDELKMMKADEAVNVAYALATGQRKTRQNREGHTQRKAEWQLLFLSSGELSLEEHLKGVGQRSYGGQAVRFCEIPAKVSEEHGSFEKLYNFVTAKALSDHLVEQTEKKCYGTAGLEFVRKLAGLGYDRTVAKVKALVSDFLRDHVPSGLSAEVTRSADRFALLAAGGELATQLGVTGWIPGTAMNSVAATFAAWRRNRGTDGKWDENGAITHVRSLLLSHGNSRFEYYEEPWNPKKGRSDSYQPIHNRLGFKTRGDDSEIEYVFHKDSLRELCHPFSFDLTIEALRRKNLLVADPNYPTARRTPPELKRGRFYVISARIFDDEQQPGLDFDEKPSSESSQPSQRPRKGIQVQ
jgi:putative DNA primase/helicase